MKSLSKRFLSAGVGLALFALFCLVFPKTFVIFGLVVIAVSLYEFYDMAIPKGALKIERALAMIFSYTLFCLCLYSIYGIIDAKFITLSLIPFLALICVPIFKSDHSELDKMPLVLCGIAYIVLPICSWPFLMKGGESGVLYVCVMLLTWLSDAGAYTLGCLFGQKEGARKLAPKISPKKSWWGFFGAVIFGVILAVVFRALGLFEFSYIHCIFLGVIASVSGVAGDLVESRWKRHFGVKDSGNILPGHGGLYDRFDSTLTSTPLITVYLLLFGLI